MRKRCKKNDQSRWTEWAQLAVRAGLILVDLLVNRIR